MKITLRNIFFILVLGDCASTQSMLDPRKPVPLKNIDSSCFMNAAVQVAYAMHKATSLLFTHLETHKKIYKKGSLAESYTDLLPSMMYGDAPKEGFDPSAFCQIGWKKLKLPHGTQADANEFLVELLLRLTYRDVLKKKLPLLTTHEGPQELQTDFARLFYVNAASKVFAYHDDGSTYESALRSDIAPCLDLKITGESRTLDDCLHSFFQPAEEKVRTEAGLVTGERHTFLQSMGQYVICTLDRRGVIEKEDEDEVIPQFFRHENPISFPLYKQSFYTYFTDQTNARETYELVGAIMHSGSANSGHYTAYVKAGNQWYYCNDETITKLNEEDMYKIAKRGYGVQREVLPTTLVYECSQERGIFPAAGRVKAMSSGTSSSSSFSHKLSSSSTSSSHNSSTENTENNSSSSSEDDEPKPANSPQKSRSRTTTKDKT